MDTKQLALTAAKARLLGLDMVYGAASGHIGGGLSAAGGQAGQRGQGQQERTPFFHGSGSVQIVEVFFIIYCPASLGKAVNGE